ncbi:hypothetical protein M758_10G157000 [Ceratodon purpureus]|nr:hypothetical protein M758_10G157000 [Ceratodon purpureus]
MMNSAMDTHSTKTEITSYRAFLNIAINNYKMTVDNEDTHFLPSQFTFFYHSPTDTLPISPHLIRSAPTRHKLCESHCPYLASPTLNYILKRNSPSKRFTR